MNEPDDDGHCAPESQIRRVASGCTWPALPTHETREQCEPKTLRDEFAMASLIGIGSSVHGAAPAEIAAHTYKIADAMLEARKGSAK